MFLGAPWGVDLESGEDGTLKIDMKMNSAVLKDSGNTNFSEAFSGSNSIESTASGIENNFSLGTPAAVKVSI